MKIKSLLKKAVAGVTALVTALSIGVNSLAALTDYGAGAQTPAQGGSYVYFWSGSDRSLLWMVEAYVSTAADGKIDTSVVSLGGESSGQLKKVGAVLYTAGSLTNTILPLATNTNKRNTTTISDFYTETKASSSSFSSTTILHLPKTTASLNPSSPYYDGREVVDTPRTTGYYVVSEDIGLPTSLAGGLDYATQVKAVIESDSFAYNIVNELYSKMGAAALCNIIKEANPTVWEKAVNYIANAAARGEEISDAEQETLLRLFPTSDDPLIQWAIVCTPIALNQASSQYKDAHCQ